MAALVGVESFIIHGVQSTVSTGGFPRRVVSADLNGDGKLDLLVSGDVGMWNERYSADSARADVTHFLAYLERAYMAL